MRKKIEGGLLTTAELVKNSSIAKRVTDTYNQSSNMAKAGAIAGFSAALATATQSKECGSEWGNTFWTTLTVLGGAAYLAPVAYEQTKKRFFSEQKKPAKTDGNEMTAVPPSNTSNSAK